MDSSQVNCIAFQQTVSFSKGNTVSSSFVPRISLNSTILYGSQIHVVPDNLEKPSFRTPLNTPRVPHRYRVQFPVSCLRSVTPPTSPGGQNNKQIDSVESSWNDLTASKFEEKIESGNLALCFVGMSNCGKSYWSWQLHENLGFNLLSVDRQIECNLESTLRADGHVGIEGLAAWMGFPTDERFAANQGTYLAAEEAITGTAKPMQGRNCVLDTTGSVVYLSEHTRRRLIRNYLVIHLEAGDDLLNVMTENYFKTPKPVVWGDSFNRQEGESENQALRRCYPALLRERRKRYAQMAHITIPASVSLDRSMNIKKMINELKTRLDG